jgi:4-hydroxybenzoate polyprenyltransferase
MLSISSEPASSSKSPSSPAVDPTKLTEGRIPSVFMPLLLVLLAVLVQGRLCDRHGSLEIWPGIIALITALALTFAWLLLRQDRLATLSKEALDSPRLSIYRKWWPAFLLGGVIVSIAAGLPFALWTVVAALLIVLSQRLFPRLVLLTDLIGAALAGILFLAAATAMGDTSAGGYPAAYAFFFVLAWTGSIAVEWHDTDIQSGNTTLATILGPRAALVLAGIFFFLFGIIASWPFLNEFYRPLYFWIVVFGVDLPLLWMWGRLRSRDKELSEPALARFNYRVRWLILIVLIALVFS